MNDLWIIWAHFCDGLKNIFFIVRKGTSVVIKSTYLLLIHFCPALGLLKSS